MGFDDKVENARIDAEGKTKEATGKVTDDEQMEAEGKVDQSEADVRKAGEKIKDAFRH
jgi:uncharacterized protein YjbJ (UPF0337 family)